MKQNKEQVLEQMCFGVLCMEDNYNDMVKCDEVLDKPVKHIDALWNKGMMEAYWKLDGNAFDDQPAPEFMKLDTLVLGGCPVVMLLPTSEADSTLVEELGTENQLYTPIGFLDLHKIHEGKFTASGLGISKQYQELGLSKNLIYAGVKIAGIEQLNIPTQLSNGAAHLAWLHLGPLTLKSANVFHNEADSVVYQVNIPEDTESILEPLKKLSPSESHDTHILDLSLENAVDFIHTKVIDTWEVKTVDYFILESGDPYGPVVTWGAYKWSDGGCHR